MGRGHLGIRHQAELTSTRSLSAACWPASAGLFFAAGPPQDKKRPLGGQQAEGAAWGRGLPGVLACPTNLGSCRNPPLTMKCMREGNRPTGDAHGPTSTRINATAAVRQPVWLRHEPLCDVRGGLPGQRP
ncbi:hypothetical protein RAN3_1382 [plant metagenome]|uniref:Uncharacterized protein n=1 Tax=plant metagenome TaxID=1297885 RepID=A0A484UE74_9ZZZZ